MASPNVQLVRSIWAAWERGDFGAIAWAHPDIEYVMADGPSPGTWKGLAGLAEGSREFLNPWEGYRAVADEYIELDDERVLVLVHDVSGRGKASGLDVGNVPGEKANLFQIRGGKVIRYVLWFDREHAIADLGVAREADSA
jgi:ketosteroid isomerase-like protein